MCILCIVLACFAQGAWAKDWHLPEHGPSDTLGAVNHLSPEKVVQAARLRASGWVRCNSRYA